MGTAASVEFRSSGARNSKKDAQVDRKDAADTAEEAERSLHKPKNGIVTSQTLSILPIQESGESPSLTAPTLFRGKSDSVMLSPKREHAEQHRTGTIQALALRQLERTLDGYKEVAKAKSFHLSSTADAALKEPTHGAPRSKPPEADSAASREDFIRKNVRYHSMGHKPSQHAMPPSKEVLLSLETTLSDPDTETESLKHLASVSWAEQLEESFEAVNTYDFEDDRFTDSPNEPSPQNRSDHDQAHTKGAAPSLSLMIEPTDSTEEKQEGMIIMPAHKLKMLSPKHLQLDPESAELLDATFDDAAFQLYEDGTVLLGQFKIGQEGLRNVADSVRSSRHRKRTAKSFSESFVIIGPLGRGASGSVVEALHLPTFNLVAIKMLPVFTAEKRKQVAGELSVLYKQMEGLHIVDESLDAGALESAPSMMGFSSSYHDLGTSKSANRRNSSGSSRCPNILSFYDAFVDMSAGYIHLVVEYMDGGSLQDIVLRGGCQDEAVLADIAHQVLQGLSYLHRHKKMHRDIKPGNILINSRGCVKIADFGISRAMNETHSFATSFVGTYCYMSPERIFPEAHGYNISSDIWSFGLTMLAVALGRFPLPSEREGYWELVDMICEKPMPLPGGEFSNEFNDFIRQCLVKDYKYRPTADQLLAHPFLANVRKVQSDSLQQIASRNRSASRATEGDQPDPVTSARVNAGDDDEELNAIRQEHLDRVLAALANKATQLKQSLGTVPEGFILDGVEPQSQQQQQQQQQQHSASPASAPASREPSTDQTAADAFQRFGSTDSLALADQSGELDQLGSCESVVASEPEAVEEGRRKRFGRSLTRENTVRAWSLLPPSGENHLNEAKWKHLAAQLYLPLSTVIRRAHEVFAEHEQQQ